MIRQEFKVGDIVTINKKSAKQYKDSWKQWIKNKGVIVRFDDSKYARDPFPNAFINWDIIGEHEFCQEYLCLAEPRIESSTIIDLLDKLESKLKGNDKERI